MKVKLSLNSKLSKPVVAINIETKERLEFVSQKSAADTLNINLDYFSRCVKNNKPCKGYTIIFKSQ